MSEDKRLYVGNLFNEVTETDLTKRFSKFGSVTKIEIKSKRDIDGEVTETFAFIDLSVSQEGLGQCIASLGNTKWKGKVLKLQQAKESFMDRLARERREREKEGAPSASDPLEKKKTEETSLRTKDLRQNTVRDLSKGLNTVRDFTEEREDFRGFGDRKVSDSKYDPMNIFKAKIAGEEVKTGMEEEPNTDNMGEVKDGLVVFGEDEDAEKGLFNVTKMKVNKVYHSSSEDEEGKDKKEAVRVKKKIKSKDAKEDKKSAEFKEKMTQRFLRIQKETQQLRVEEEVLRNKAKADQKAQNKYYSDSDEESNGDTKTGMEVLENFQSFASDVWRDSDEEAVGMEDIVENEIKDDQEIEEDKYEKEEDEDDSDEDEDDSDDSKDEENENGDSEEEEDHHKDDSFSGASLNIVESTMVRYDPTSDNQEKFLRIDPADPTEAEAENIKGPTSKGFFSVTSDLKEAFTAGQSSTFSFGFGKQETPTEAEPTAMEEGDDEDDEIVTKKVDDVAASFGLQLRGKGGPKSEMTFFFTAEDPRLEEGLDFFFNHQVDRDQLREKFNLQRPVLAEILKKRARSQAQKDKAAGARKKGAGRGGWRRGGKIGRVSSR